MYDVYIKNYLGSDGSSLVSSETPLFGVPIQPGSDNKVFADPVIKTEMGKAGSMDFSIRPNHDYYNLLQQMRTIIRVDFDNDTLFRGRVLTVDNSHFSGEKKIHLEGDMAFLMDSQIPGVKDEDRPEITILQYLTDLINSHNSQMLENGETDKTFELGEVPGKYSSTISEAQKISVANDKFGSSSWRRAMDALDDLVKKYGGYFRTRFIPANRSSDGQEHHYIDWLQAYFNSTVNSQPIEVTSNLIDINSTTEVNNLFTVVIPIGDNNGAPLYVEGYTPSGHAKRTTKTIKIPELLEFCSDAELTRGYHNKEEYRNAIKQYGIIYKTQSFSNAKTQNVLWDYAIDWMKNNYVGGIRNFTVSALDFHHIDRSKQKYMSGDQVTVIFPDATGSDGSHASRVTKTMTILSAQYKMYTPDKNSYTIGVPNDLLQKDYGTKNKKNSTKNAYTPDHNGDPPDPGEIYRSIDEYKQLANDYIVNHRYNNDIYATLMAEDPKKAERAMTSTVVAITEGFLAADGRPTSGEHKKRIQKIIVDGIQGSLTINGPIDHSHDLTDEQVDLINKQNKFAVFDSIKQEFGLRAAIESTTDIGKLTTHVPTLIQMKLQKGLQDLKSGKVDVYGENKNTNPNAAQTVGLDGKNGAMNAVMSKLGLDGTGGLSTIVQDGPSSMIGMLNPSKAGSTSLEDRVLELTGSNDGEIGVGKEDDGSGVKKWQIAINKPITYTDSEGHTHTVPAGTVSAKDFNLKEVPSFKTKFAAIDTAFIGVVYTNQLDAINAFIQNLQSQTAIIDNISAKTSRAGTFRGDEYILNVTGSSTDPSGAKYLRNCLAGCLVYAGNGGGGDNNEKGKIYFKFSKIDGTEGPVVNFNIADTQTYKDAVSAAWNNGGKTAYLSGGGETLNPGGSAMVTAYYVNDAGRTGQVPSNSDGRPIQVQVKARALDHDTDLVVTPTGSTLVNYCAKDGFAKVTVNGDSNLVPGNIKSGVWIYGKQGTYTGSGTVLNDDVRLTATKEKKTSQGSRIRLFENFSIVGGFWYYIDAYINGHNGESGNPNRKYAFYVNVT